MKKLRVPGMGCPKRVQLGANAEAAAQAVGIEYELTADSPTQARRPASASAGHTPSSQPEEEGQ